MRFGFDALDRSNFGYENNRIITAFFAALSSVFPPGEEEFVASVRNYLDAISDDPQLLKEVRGFIGQESHHADQHRRLNEIIAKLGLDTEKIEAHLRSHIEEQHKVMTDAQRLAATVAMEHITAVLAHYMLTYPETLDPAPESIRALLKWHAVEEIEHKAVAFDVFKKAVDSEELRTRVFWFAVTEFTIRITAYQWALMLMARQVPTPRELFGAAKFFFGRKGLITKTLKPVLDFARPDFHPWDIDDRELVEAWKRTQTELKVAA